MQLLFIHATDAVSTSCDEGANYNTPEDALAVGVRGAVGILADDIKARCALRNNRDGHQARGWFSDTPVTSWHIRHAAFSWRVLAVENSSFTIVVVGHSLRLGAELMSDERVA